MLRISHHFITCARRTQAQHFHLQKRSMASESSPLPTAERTAELAENLKTVRQKVTTACEGRDEAGWRPLLVAVSKLKPSTDIMACYAEGQRDFGENYVQELVDKAKQLPQDIRWHFIGTLQSNKSKILASISNLYSLQTLASSKAADALNKALPTDREPLNVLLQVNTSGEDSKSGLPPLSDSASDAQTPPSELHELARHIIDSCPRLHLQGLMTIGSLSESLSQSEENHDFVTLSRTRESLETRLQSDYLDSGNAKWGEQGKLLLSMGMSSDFEVALKAGSDIIRVGTGIFGERPKKAQN